MSLDLLNITPHQVSRDLRGYSMFFYGEPKSGKTTIATKFPRHLLLAFEKGYNAIPGAMAQPVNSWSEFRKVLKIASKVDQTSQQAMMKYNFENGEKEVWNDEKHFVFTLQDGSVFGLEKTDTIKNGTFSIVSDLNGFTTPNRGSSDLCRYVVNQNASVQESCESMKNFTVKACEAGTFLYNGSCVPNDVAHCKIQTRSLACDECNEGFWLDGPYYVKGQAQGYICTPDGMTEAGI